MTTRIDWDSVDPQTITLANLREAEDTDFPHTYSGQSWRAAARIARSVRDDELASLDPWNLAGASRESIRGLDLTGFMVGWACGVLRQMVGQDAGNSGAVIELGVGPVKQAPITESAGATLRKVL